MTELVQRSTDFVRSALLEHLRFESHVEARSLTQQPRGQQWRVIRVSGDMLCGFLEFGEGNDRRRSNVGRHGGSVRSRVRRRLLTQELNDSQHQRCSRRRLRNPEAEQALGKTRLELSEPLLELRIKSREVELVQLPEVRPISRIDHIEPIHELVGNVITKLLIELARQFGRDRHMSSCRMPGYHNSTLGKPWYQENAAPLTNVALKP